MDTTVILIIVAIVISALFTWLVIHQLYRSRYTSYNEIIDNTRLQLEQAIHEKQTALELKQQQSLSLATVQATNGYLQQQLLELESLKEKYQESQKANTILEAGQTFYTAQIATQKEEMEAMAENFRLQFDVLAQKILEEKSKKFTELNVLNMNEILKPFKSDLTELHKKVTETYDKESRERFSLGREVEKLVAMTQQVSTDAHNLTNALKGGNKMQGHWGEMILESILENSGLAKNREYFVQEFLRDNAGNVIKDENGKGLQPDAMIVYPDQRKIIIDSKVSLVAWEACVAATDQKIQHEHLMELCGSIRRHVQQLSSKNYPHHAGALDYVLLFVPIEPAFLEALKQDVALWKFAYDKNIVIVSPNNLLAVLKIVAGMWKVEQQNRNALAMVNKAGSLYDKFAGFVEQFELIGKKVHEAGDAYDHAHKQLTSGRGNITTRIQELSALGARHNKKLPDRLFEEADDVIDNLNNGE